MVLDHVDSTIDEMHIDDIVHVEGGSWHQWRWEKQRNSSAGEQSEVDELHSEVWLVVGFGDCAGRLEFLMVDGGYMKQINKVSLVG